MKTLEFKQELEKINIAIKRINKFDTNKVQIELNNAYDLAKKTVLTEEELLDWTKGKQGLNEYLYARVAWKLAANTIINTSERKLDALLEALKGSRIMLNTKVWQALTQSKEANPVLVSKVFDSLLDNGISIDELSFGTHAALDFLESRIKSSLEQGEKADVKRLLPAYVKGGIWIGGKELLNELLKDADLEKEVNRNLVEGLALTGKREASLNASLLVEKKLVTPSLLVACYAEYFNQYQIFTKNNSAGEARTKMKRLEDSFKVLQADLLGPESKPITTENNVMGLAINQFREAESNDFGARAKLNKPLPEVSDIITKSSIDVLNKMLGVDRKDGREMTTIESIYSTIQKFIEFVFGGGVEKETLEAVKTELGMLNKQAQIEGRH